MAQVLKKTFFFPLIFFYTIASVFALGEKPFFLEHVNDKKIKNLSGLEKMAWSGDPHAINVVALEMAKINREKAFKLLQLGIDQSNNKAYFIKGQILFEGIGGPRNRTEGRSLITQASEEGVGEASIYLANLALNTGNLELAYKYLSADDPYSWGYDNISHAARALALKAFFSCSLCPKMVKSDIPIDGQMNFCFPIDDAKAYDLANKSSQESDYYGHIVKGLMHFHGLYVQKDEEVGKSYFDMAYELGGHHSLYVISKWIDGDNLKAYYLEKAAEEGDLEAIVELAEKMEKEGNKKRSCDLYQRAQQKGYPSSLVIENKCHLKDKGEYLAALIKEAKDGSEDAYCMLVTYHRDKLEAAKNYFDMAHQLGFEKVHLSMGLVYLHNKDEDGAFHHFFEWAKVRYEATACASCVEYRIKNIKFGNFPNIQDRLLSEFEIFVQNHSYRHQSNSFLEMGGLSTGASVLMVGGLLYMAYKKGYMSGVGQYLKNR